MSADRIAETVAVLRAWCEREGHYITADGSVYEDVAARILDRSPGTLANWRSNGGSLVPFYRAGRGGRIRYRLVDLAEYLERQRVW